MSRKYKDPKLQDQYDVCYNRGADDFMRRRGGSIQNAFMDGYKGFKAPRFFVRTSFTYQAYMAGKDRKAAENAGKIIPAEVQDLRLLEVR